MATSEPADTGPPGSACNAPVLHVAALADHDGVTVGAQHRPVPDARLSADRGASDEQGAGGDERSSGDVSEDGIIFPGQDAVASERLVRATWVLVRRDGGWRIASYHNSPAS